MRKIESVVGTCFRRRMLIVAGLLTATALAVAACGRDEAPGGGGATHHGPASQAAASVEGGGTPTDAHGHGHDADQSMHEEGAVGSGGQPGADGVVWGCECCPEVRSSEPGICPECNMYLTPVETGQAGSSGTGLEEPSHLEGGSVWTCPMHPDIQSDGPGQCPECNMDLVPEREGEQSNAGASEAADQWTCGMHPAIRSEEPGKCPICNMDLVPVAQGNEAAVRIDRRALELVGAGGAVAEYIGLVTVVRTVGRVEYDERLVKHVASRVGGRVERLYADFVGTRVTAGEPLLSIYSPELVSALADYRNSLEAARNGVRLPGETARSGLDGLARSARVRLNLWGLTDAEIDRVMESQAEASYKIAIRSPISGTVIEKHAFEGEYVREGQNLFMVADLSRVWVTADLFEQDIGYIEPGDKVLVKAEAYPGEAFEGRVAFIDPYVNEKTRAARMRMELSNPDGRLKPGMYVEATLEAPVERRSYALWMCPMHPEVATRSPGECPICGMFLEEVGPGEVLAIPKSAVVHKGETALVYVTKSRGVYEPRQVWLGQVGVHGPNDQGLYYQVTDGLMPGEMVLTDAGFLVHSQARLTGQAASAYGGALDVGSAGSEHNH